MVVVEPLAAGQEGEDPHVARAVREALVADPVRRAVDRGVEENVEEHVEAHAEGPEDGQRYAGDRRTRMRLSRRRAHHVQQRNE